MDVSNIIDHSSLSDTSSLETGQQSLTDGSVYCLNDSKSNISSIQHWTAGLRI